MGIKTFQKTLLLFILIYIVSLITACSIFPHKDTENSLRQRVDMFMNAKINNNWGDVYSYLDPAYRKTITKNEFIQRNRAVHFKDYSIETIEMGAANNEATVKVKYSLTAKDYDFNNITEIQQWTMQSGKWFIRVPKPDISEIFK